MTDKESKKLKQQNHPRYLGLSNMRQSLSEVVKLRKQQEVKGPASSANPAQEDNTSPKSKSKERPGKKGNQGQSGPAATADPLAATGGAGAADSRKNPLNADTALVRYCTRDEVRVLRDQDFAKEFQRRPNDEYWNEVEVIQTCIKATTGCGEPVICKFMA